MSTINITTPASHGDTANAVNTNHDYTEWQRERWSDKSIEEIHVLVTEYEKNTTK